MYQGPNQPRKPRIPAPQPPVNVEELDNPITDTPSEVPAPTESSVSAIPTVEEPTADTGHVLPAEDNEDKPKKKAGRPAGSKSTPKQATPAPKSDTRHKKQENVDLDKRIRTALYLLPKDHKRLKMLCVDIDTSMTEFGEAACLAAMYSSYQCAAPDCNCEFVIRNSLSDAAPSCPMCGGKKLSRPYLP